MHKLRPLTEYQRKDGWRFVRVDLDSLDAFRTRMESYRTKPVDAVVRPIKRVAK